jgi:L-threonine kinase
LEKLNCYMSRAVVRMPGTCGELVQGAMDGISFHISCPVNIYSVVEVELDSNIHLLDYSTECPKAASAVRKTLEFLGHPNLGGRLSIQSSIPIGKGMASSTADVAAAIEATALVLGERLEESQVAELALSIEPTDGSLFQGITLFDHRKGKLCQSLGLPPPIDIVVLDFGGEVNTIEFNHRNHGAVLQRLEPRITEALELVCCGIASGDPILVGQGAAMSAQANQDILFKSQLEQVISLAREVGAAGVNVAHSGTVVGILLDARRCDKEAIADFVRKRVDSLERLLICSLIGGGCECV